VTTKGHEVQVRQNKINCHSKIAAAGMADAE